MKTDTTQFESNCPQCGATLPKDAPMGMCPQCLLAQGQKNDPSRQPDMTPGFDQKEFGDYELLEIIARGGMGVVYKAHQKSLHRDVALKMILSGQLATESEVNRFNAEAKAAAHLRHPNIVTVHEVGEIDGRHFYSMEFVEGRHLGDRMEQEPLTIKQAVQYLIKIGRAVHHAHQQGIVHRDLKPQNILLDKEDEPRITDFGLAKRMDLEGDLTLTGTVIGSPAYMAPEQAQGKHNEVGPLTDVYALGALLYCMIGGRPPFRASTPLETLKQVSETNPQPLRQIDPKIPVDLETICLKCLEKEPAHRYASTDELVRELERWMSNEPIQARPSTTKERIQKWVRRNPVMTSMSALVLFVGIIAFIAVTWQLKQTKSALAKAERLIIAEATARATEMKPYLTMTHDGPVSSVAFSKDGNRILSGSHDQTARIWNAHSGDVISEFTGHNGVVGKALFSTDEKRVLTLSFDIHFRYPHLSPTDDLLMTRRIPRFSDKSVRVWNVETGTNIAVLPHSDQVVDADFAPDGKHVVTASWDHMGRVWNVQNEQEIHTLSYHQAALLSAQFSPDGSHVVTTSSGNDYQITIHPGGGGGSTSSVHEEHLGSVWNVETGESVGLVDNLSRNGFFFGRPSSSRCIATYSPDGSLILFAGGNPSNCLLWNVSRQRIEHVLDGHTSELIGARFNATGTKIISYGADRTARIWDTKTGEQAALLTAHKDTILWAEFSPDGNLVVTASGDGTARVWDANSGVGISVLKGHLDKVYQARFSPNGLRVVTASEDGTLKLWDAATLTRLSKTFRGHEGHVISIDISSDGQKVVTGSTDGSARLWDLNIQENLEVLRGYEQIDDDQVRRHALGDVKDVRFSADGKYVFTASEDSRAILRPVDMSRKPSGQDVLLAPFSPLRMWNAQNGSLAKRFEDLQTGMKSVRSSEDGYLLMGIPDGEVSEAIRLKGLMGRGWQGNSQQVMVPLDLPVWEMPSGRERCRISGLMHPVHDAAFSKDGKWIATADKGPVRVWSATDGDLIKELTTTDEALSVQFTDDTDRLFVRDMRGVSLINWNEDIRVQSFASPTIPFYQATLCSDERVLGWTQEGMVCLFDRQSSELMIQLEKTSRHLKKALLTPDAAFIVTIGMEKEARVWDANTGELLETLEGHEDDLLNGVISSDGKWLGTVSEDYTARLWPLSAIRTIQ